MSISRVWSGSPFEEKAGYCRAIRIDDRIWVAATAPFSDDGTVAAVGDMKGQTARALEIIADALEQLDARMSDVVITRMYVTDISRAAELSEAHHRAFSEHPPAATLVEVSALVHPDLLIEIEVEAVVSHD